MKTQEDILGEDTHAHPESKLVPSACETVERKPIAGGHNIFSRCVRLCALLWLLAPLFCPPR